MAEAERIKALGEAAERDARDPVNQPMINNWVEAMGDTNPRWQAGEAPPSMAQVWTMYGQGGKPPADDPLHGMMNVLTDAGLHRRARHQLRADLRAHPPGRRAGRA